MKWLLRALVLGIVVASSMSLQGSGRDLDVWANFVGLMSRFFPPDFSILPDLAGALVETLRIAVMATVSATIAALPIALGSSQRFAPTWLRSAMLFFQAAIRTVPSLIWALLAVAVVGANEVAGVFALAFYSIGYLGKFFADAIDTIPVEGAKLLEANGAHPVQAFQYGLWPEAVPLFRRHVLWMFEYNVRSASIIGYVGAGGIGTRLHVYQEYGQWDRFCAVLIVILVLVIGLELIARRWNKAD